MPSSTSLEPTDNYASLLWLHCWPLICFAMSCNQRIPKFADDSMCGRCTPGPTQHSLSGSLQCNARFRAQAESAIMISSPGGRTITTALFGITRRKATPCNYQGADQLVFGEKRYFWQI